MHNRFRFLEPKWAGIGTMITGIFCGGYEMFRIIEYAIYGDIPPLYGTVQMSFSTAFLGLFKSVALFWIGFICKDIRCEFPQIKHGVKFTAAQIAQLLAVAISALSLIATALIGLLRK